MEAAGFGNIGKAGTRSKLVPALAEPCFWFKPLKSVAANPLGILSGQLFGFYGMLGSTSSIPRYGCSGGWKGPQRRGLPRSAQGHPDLCDCSAIPGGFGVKPAWLHSPPVPAWGANLTQNPSAGEQEKQCSSSGACPACEATDVGRVKVTAAVGLFTLRIREG